MEQIGGNTDDTGSGDLGALGDDEFLGDSSDSENIEPAPVQPGHVTDMPAVTPMEVTVDHNIERALRVLKRKLIREGTFKDLKTRRYHEKPSERKKRKGKEALKRARKEELRQKKYANGQL